MDQGTNGTTQTDAEPIEAVVAVATRTLRSYRLALVELDRLRAQVRASTARARNNERVARKAVRLFHGLRPRMRELERLRREAEGRARAAEERARAAEERARLAGRAATAERGAEEPKQNGSRTRGIRRIEQRLTRIGREAGRRA